MTKSLLPLAIAFAFSSNVFAATNYEIRMPSGADPAPTVEEVASVDPDGSLNTSTTSAVPILTDDTGVTVSTLYRNGGHAAYRSWQAFDGDGGIFAGHGWMTDDNITSGWIAYEFTAPIVINKYAIWSNSGWGTAALPKTFALEGSNDGISWTVLGSEALTASSYYAAEAFSYFTAVNGDAYTRYRLNISGNFGAITTGTYGLKFIEAQ